LADWRKIAITLKIPRVGVRYVESASLVHKVEFELIRRKAGLKVKPDFQP